MDIRQAGAGADNISESQRDSRHRRPLTHLVVDHFSRHALSVFFPAHCRLQLKHTGKQLLQSCYATEKFCSTLEHSLFATIGRLGTS